MSDGSFLLFLLSWIRIKLTSWHSGIVNPLNRIPSSGSRLLVSQSMHLTPLAPPMSWSIVTFPMTLPPCSFFSDARATCFPGTCSARVSWSVDAGRTDDEETAAAEGSVPPVDAAVRRRRVRVAKEIEQLMVSFCGALCDVLEYEWIQKTRSNANAKVSRYKGP